MIEHASVQNIINVNANFYNVTGIDNDRLAQEILARQERMSDHSSEAPFEDTWFDETNGPESERIIKKLKDHFASLNLNLIEQWSQIHYPRESTNLHDHAPRDYAFVYYVKVPEKSGDIVFRFEEAYIKHTGFTPSEKTLIVFPGWCKHFVTKNLSNDIRISIAGNLNVGTYDR